MTTEYLQDYFSRLAQQGQPENVVQAIVDYLSRKHPKKQEIWAQTRLEAIAPGPTTATSLEEVDRRQQNLKLLTYTEKIKYDNRCRASRQRGF